MATSRQWTVGIPNDDTGGMCLARGHFVAAEAPVPEPAEGEVLIRTQYFSPDPMNHAWVRGIPGKFDALAPGAVMRGGIAGKVVASRNPRWQVGDIVTGFLDWADYTLSNGTDHLGLSLYKLPEGFDPATGLATLGMTGLCAWLGLVEIGKPQPGDTVLVSGASGGIGSLAGQIAKLSGVRVVGIAGGPEKCALLTAMGFDAAIDYKGAPLAEQIAAACPDGVDVFFDNVGGSILDAALVSMNNGGRIVICGGTMHYGSEPVPIFNHMQLAMRNLSMAGFFYFNLVHRWAEGRARLAAWLKEGLIRETLDIADGFDAVPEAAIGQFHGGVSGRKLVRID